MPIALRIRAPEPRLHKQLGKPSKLFSPLSLKVPVLETVAEMSTLALSSFAINALAAAGNKVGTRTGALGSRLVGTAELGRKRCPDTGAWCRCSVGACGAGRSCRGASLERQVHARTGPQPGRLPRVPALSRLVRLTCGSAHTCSSSPRSQSTFASTLAELVANNSLVFLVMLLTLVSAPVAVQSFDVRPRLCWLEAC